jgi:hypothetical protein
LNAQLQTQQTQAETQRNTTSTLGQIYSSMMSGQGSGMRYW